MQLVMIGDPTKILVQDKLELMFWVYKNTFNRSYMHANEKATDVCAPKTREYGNILMGNSHIYNGATMTGSFSCPE